MSRRTQPALRTLTDAQVIALRAEYAAGGTSYAKVGVHYNLSPNSTRQIVLGLAYADVPMEEAASPTGPRPPVWRGRLTPAQAAQLRYEHAAQRIPINTLAKRAGISWATAREYIRRGPCAVIVDASPPKAAKAPTARPPVDERPIRVCRAERAKRAKRGPSHAELMALARRRFAAQEEGRRYP